MLYCLPLNKCKAFFSLQKATGSMNTSAFCLPWIYQATISYTNIVLRCTTVNVSEIQTISVCSVFRHLWRCVTPVGLYISMPVIHCTGINKHTHSNVQQFVLNVSREDVKPYTSSMHRVALCFKACIIDFIQLAVLWNGAVKTWRR